MVDFNLRLWHQQWCHSYLCLLSYLGPKHQCSALKREACFYSEFTENLVRQSSLVSFDRRSLLAEILAYLFFLSIPASAFASFPVFVCWFVCQGLLSVSIRRLLPPAQSAPALYFEYTCSMCYYCLLCMEFSSWCLGSAVLESLIAGFGGL